MQTTATYHATQMQGPGTYACSYHVRFLADKFCNWMDQGTQILNFIQRIPCFLKSLHKQLHFTH